ncbi:MAG: hypothetical protein MUF71_12600, partial [Candidatus Kapabacteria bacterium]|nr:hypothetical protein [Candidatus Kapabacteria bacterium]
PFKGSWLNPESSRFFRVFSNFFCLQRTVKTTVKFIDNFDEIAYTTIVNKASKAKSGASLQEYGNCQWGPYLSQLVTCGYTIGYLSALSLPVGTLLYGACAYDAICSYCSNTRVAHSICR